MYPANPTAAAPSRRGSLKGAGSLLTAWLLLFSLLLVSGCTFLEPDDNTAAVYTAPDGSEQTVTRAELAEQFKLHRQLIDPSYPAGDDNLRLFLEEYIVLQKVMLPSAQSGGEPTGLDVATETATYKQQVIDLIYQGDKSAFDRQMKKLGLTDDHLTRLVENDLTLRRYKAQQIGEPQPAAAELRAYYDLHKGEFATGTLSHILVKTEQEALTAKKRLDAGENFAALAKELSLDPTASANGGTLTGVDFNQFVEGFRNAAATLKLHQVSPPVLSDYGWHLIRVDERHIPSFEEAKAKLTAHLIEENKNAAWNAFYETTRQAADIRINI